MVTIIAMVNISAKLQNSNSALWIPRSDVATPPLSLSLFCTDNLTHDFFLSLTPHVNLQTPIPNPDPMALGSKAPLMAPASLVFNTGNKYYNLWQWCVTNTSKMEDFLCFLYLSISVLIFKNLRLENHLKESFILTKSNIKV